MESLYLLIPLSVLLVLALLGLFGWALEAGQFEELEHEAERILADETPSLDADQGAHRLAREQSFRRDIALSSEE